MNDRREAVEIKGVIARGNAVGRELGYPTANIYDVEGVGVPDGVYAVTAHVEGEEKPWRGMANLGKRPTVEGLAGKRVLEFHLFGFSGDLYGRKAAVCLRSYIRPERVFAGTEQLRRQLGEDEKTVRKYFDDQK